MATRAPRQKMDQTKPIYRVLEISYIDDQLLDPESTAIDPETDDYKPLLITYEGEPGYNLEPWNDVAKKVYAKFHPEGLHRRFDPIAELTHVRPGAPTA